MKLRHVTSISTFLIAFMLSLMIVGTSAQKSSAYEISTLDRPPVILANAELQARLLKFLQNDRQTGIELSNEKLQLKKEVEQSIAESSATFNLVRKMVKVKCDGLPEDFCGAWNEHINAWTKMAKFLDQHNSGQHCRVGREVIKENYAEINSQINDSYNNLLSSARSYGVVFQY